MKKSTFAVISILLTFPAAVAFGVAEIPGAPFPPANRVNPIPGPVAPGPAYSAEQTTQMMGTIGTIDAKSGEMTVTGDAGQAMEFRVTANTPITYQLQPIPVNDLIPGDRVTVYCDTLFGGVQRVDRL